MRRSMLRRALELIDVRQLQDYNAVDSVFDCEY